MSEPSSSDLPPPTKGKSFWLNFITSIRKTLGFLQNPRKKAARGKCKKNLACAKDAHKSMDKLVSMEEIVVDDVIVPRADITAASSDISPKKLAELFVKCGYSRIPIYQDNLDNIIGYVHIKDLFAAMVEEKPKEIKGLLRKHIIAPHSMKLPDLLEAMRKNRTHIAVAVDEYGGTDGIVTLRDVTTEIFGKLHDEHDRNEEEIGCSVVAPGIIITGARVEVEELEALLGLKLKDAKDEFDTIGGLVLAKAGHVPRKGDVIHITEKVSVEILDSTPRALKQLKIICNEEDIAREN